MNSSSALAGSSRSRVRLLDPGHSYRAFQDEYDAAYRRVMESGQYILGPELEAFEAEFAAYCGARCSVGVASGLDALMLILRAYGIGPGDEVIVPAHTFIATWHAVTHAGAIPVPVDVLENTFNIDPDRIDRAVTSRTRAIIAVHLYGQPAMMSEIRGCAARHELRLIEDAAQAHGAEYRGSRAGALADASGFSFYPAKNLGAFGDGGAVVTDDPSLADRVRRLRNYGASGKYDHDLRGFNSRLDPLQAAFLRTGLKHLDGANARRAEIARAYFQGLPGVPGCGLPAVAAETRPAWHLFVIRHPDRDRLRKSLESSGIETLIHYPVPPHLSPAYAGLGFKSGDFPVAERLAASVLSIPMGPHLDDPSVERVIQTIDACGRRGE
jgi:dTDP-3-amino-3,4,6-trideoxy-alpha-D-glucose transaminase